MSGFLSRDTAALKILFTEDLYRIDDTAKIEAMPLEERVPATFSYQGENNRSFLVIVDQMRQGDMETILKIMAAKGLELRDLAVMSHAENAPITFQSLKDFFACSRICLFGIGPAIIGIQGMPLNTVVTHDGVKVLYGPGLGPLMSDISLKKAFWSVLKEF